MFKLFRKKRPAVVVVTLNARLEPVDRGDIEDAFDSAMAKHGHGARVVGGGTMLAPNGEISQCDIEIELDDPSDAMIKLVIGTLNAMLAPKGSRMMIPEGNRVIEFGSLEGLALYLNGTELPDAVYRDCSANHVFEECQRLLEGVGHVSSSWQGASETALYMYGPDFTAMRQRIEPFVGSYPLCEKARIEQIA